MGDILAILEGFGSNHQRIQLDFVLQMRWDQKVAEFLIALSSGLVSLKSHGHLGQSKIDIDFIDGVLKTVDFEFLGQKSTSIKYLI